MTTFKNINGNAKTFFGTRKSDNTRIQISKPSWDCDWYWGFGYLGNRNEHYHLDSYQSEDIHLTDDKGKFHMFTQKRNINMYDALLEDYDLAPNIKKHLWTFCELVLTAYALKDTAETLGRGGSHMTSNPCASIIKNTAEVKRINEICLPAIFEQLNAIYEGTF